MSCGRLRRILLVFQFVLAVCLFSGCGPSDDRQQDATANGSDSAAASDQYRDELVTYAIDSLNRLEEFDSAAVLEQTFRRLETKTAQGGVVDPLTAAWPDSEMLRQVIDRLNQWIRMQQPPGDWKPDPMIGALPAPLADLPQIKDLGLMEFSRFDGYALHECVLLRDLGKWAAGNAMDDVDRAATLFDWIVRNIQLEANSPQRIPLFPWETLLFGHGTATERAWVFILTARQLGIDAAMLALEDGERDGKGEGGEVKGEVARPAPRAPRPWCVGVLIEGKVYLFDPQIGLAIPAPKGIGRDESGQLTIRPATLAQLGADEKLLRQMDVDATHVYGVKASDLKRVVVMLEASPIFLARRMELLESRLAGPRKMVVSISPSSQAERWKAAALPAVQLWSLPFETLERRETLDINGVRARLAAIVPFFAMPSAPLHRGRLLHLKGKLLGDDGAVHYYQLARPSNEDVLASSAHEVEKRLRLIGKHDASYWLGLIAFHRGNYPSAANYFLVRTLEALPNSPWTNGARYNLARSVEASGDAARAILLYESDSSGPGVVGERLRAKWLKESAADKPR